MGAGSQEAAVAKNPIMLQIESEIASLLNELSRDSPISSRAVIAEYRHRNPKIDDRIADMFVDTALIKLLNQIISKTKVGLDQDGPDLFGDYPSIRGYLGIRTSGAPSHARAENATRSDLEAYINKKANRPTKKSRQMADIERLLENMRKAGTSDNTTISEFLKGRHNAKKPPVRAAFGGRPSIRWAQSLT